MGEWRMRARDGGMENESKGWGEWRMRARDGGVENESEGWGVENESKRKTLHLLGHLSLTYLTSTPSGRRYCDFQEEDSTLVGSSVFDISDIYPKWKTFVQRCHAANDS
ncbi:hypothetical protein LSAT2_026144, partial [Lamellibrachia satsuma]